MSISKNPKLILCILFFFVVGCSNNHQKIITNITEYLDANLTVLNNYRAISYKLVDTLKRMDLEELDSTDLKKDTAYNYLRYKSEKDYRLMMGIKASNDTAARTDFNNTFAAIRHHSYIYKILTMSDSELKKEALKKKIDSIFYNPELIKYQYKVLLSKYNNLPPINSFTDSMYNSAKVSEGKIYTVIHKFRISINGNNTLFTKLLYLDTDYKVISMANINR